MLLDPSKPENPESLSDSTWEPPDFMIRGLLTVLEWLSAFLLVLISSPAGQTLSFLSEQTKGLVIKWKEKTKKTLQH